MRKLTNKTDKTRAEWCGIKISRMFEDGTLNADNAVQRGLVWKVEKKSLLIESLIFEDPIPPIYVAKYGDKYSLIDGKQRTNAIYSFMNDDFELKGLEPIELEDSETGEIEEFDLNGKTFSELPESIREDIKMSPITTIIINEPSEDKICETFYKLNNGMALNAITTTRVKAKSRKEITQIGQHELFKNALTKAAFERYTNEDIVVKSWILLNQEEPSLEQKTTRYFMENVELKETDMVQLEECFDRILNVYNLIEDKKTRRKLITRTHMISIIPIVWESIEKGLSDKQFEEWFVTFFTSSRTTISKVYNDCCRVGTLRKDSVCKRLKEISKHFHSYFADTLPKSA